MVSNVVYYGFDAAAKLTKDVEATAQTGRLFNTALTYINLGVAPGAQVLQPLSNTVRIVTEFAHARNWISKANALVSGEAAGKKANGTWDEKRLIWIEEETSIPNVLKISSMVCLLVSDVLSTLKWLDNLQIANLAQISSFVGRTPVLGVLITGIAFDSARHTLGIIGFVFDIADAGRDIMQNGLTLNNGLQVVGDVAKIASLILIGSTGSLFVIAIVANGTASCCYLARFFMKTYSVGI